MSQQFNRSPLAAYARVPYSTVPYSHAPPLTQPANTALAFSAPLPWGGQLEAAMTPPVAKQFVNGVIVLGALGLLTWGVVEIARAKAA